MAEQENNEKKKQEAQPISFSASDLLSPSKTPQHAHAKPAEEKPSFELVLPPFLKNIFEKEKNRKYLIYSILAIIIILSILPRIETTTYPSFISTDPFWQYRHAQEIYEHGYPGTEIRPLTKEQAKSCWREPACTFDRKNIYWDTLHDAPTGGAAPIELYQYFVAYSYKYFAKFLFPTLFDWMRVTPILFGILSALTLFLIGHEIRDDITGLAAAFIFLFSGNIIVPTLFGFADSNSIILFLFLVSTYLFFRTWATSSYKYALASGVSLGLTGFATPSSYIFLPIFLAGSAILYFIYKLVKAIADNPKVQSAEGQPAVPQKSFKEVFSESIKDDSKKYLLCFLIIAIGLGLVTVLESPFHANIGRTALSLLQLQAGERSVASGVSNVFVTVMELQKTSFRQLVFLTHVSIFVLLITYLFAFPFEKAKLLPRNNFYSIFIGLFFAVMLFAAISAGRALQFFMIPVAIIGGISISLLAKKISLKKPITSFFIIAFLLALFFLLPNVNSNYADDTKRAPFVQNAFDLGDFAIDFSYGYLPLNFFDFFDWAKESTPKGAIFASWWDHGHEFTALAQRPIVADGSQNFQHVNDLAKFFVSTNAEAAVPILQKYNVSYVFTSSDMFGKYGSILQIANGTVVRQQALPLEKIYPLPNNTTNYVYELRGGSGVQIILTVDGTGEANAVLTQKYNSTKIGRVYYMQNGVLRLKSNEDSPGNYLETPFYFTPEYYYTIPLLGDVENSMLVRLQLFNGLGIENHFELVKDFEGTVKVYKVHY